jgi:hypothetical protein
MDFHIEEMGFTSIIAHSIRSIRNDNLMLPEMSVILKFMFCQGLIPGATQTITDGQRMNYWMNRMPLLMRLSLADENTE